WIDPDMRGILPLDGFRLPRKLRARIRRGDFEVRCNSAFQEVIRGCAENPQTFMPSPGRVTDYHAPGGLGVRVDSGLYAGYRIPSTYDSLIAKLIVHGQTRNECLMRLRRALEEFVIVGVDTSIPLHQRLIGAQDFINGDYDIHWLEKFVAGNA
ncbi:MAG TPA: hypothetical protein VIS03_19185, partial [Kiloniellaceae bacterium]